MIINRRSLLGLIAGLPLAKSAIAMAVIHAPILRVISTGDGRKLEISSWLPDGEAIATILFSHGFASAPRHYMPIISAWVTAGYEVHAPLHMDSRDHLGHAKLQGMDSWAARIQDMRALSANHGADHAAIGHSFGGLGVLTMGGASALPPNGIEGSLRDSRTKCAFAFSPPGPTPPLIDKAGYGSITVPAFIQTGTRDVLIGSVEGTESWRDHLSAFEEGPARGDRYGLVLAGVDHYFGGLICDPSKTGPDQSSALRVAIDASLKFLASYGPSGSGKIPSFATDSTAEFYRR